MDKKNFYVQVKRLADLFGIKNYNEDRVELIWKEVNQLSDMWLTQTVDLFIGNLRQAPLLPEFREEITKERERLWKLQKRDDKINSNVSQFVCVKCTGVGLVWETNGCVFRCYCESGNKRPENYPRMSRGQLREA